MLKELSAIPLRPHPELTVLPSQPSPPVIRAWKGDSPQISSPLSPYNFDPPTPGSRSPYSARRAPDTPHQPKTPKTPKTPHATPSRRLMSKKSFGTLARRLSFLTSRHAPPSPDTPPPMPPPYTGPPLFSLPVESPKPPESLVLGSYPQFSPSSFFRGIDALKHDDDAISIDHCPAINVVTDAKGLGLVALDGTPTRTGPSAINLPSPPPRAGLPPNPLPLFSRISLFDAEIVDIPPEGPLSVSLSSDDRQSIDLGPMLFGAPSSTKHRASAPALSSTTEIHARRTNSSDDGTLLPGSLKSLFTIPTIPSFPLDELAKHNSNETLRGSPLPALREIEYSFQAQRTSYSAPSSQHASPHVCVGSPPASSIPQRSLASLSPPSMPVSSASQHSSRTLSPQSGRDPLEELIAVAAELKSMVRPPSLSGRAALHPPSPAFTTVTALSSPTIPTYQDAKALAAEFEAAGGRVLEIRVHSEDIPAIVVVRPESMYSLHAQAFYPGGAEPVPGAEPEEYLLAPPLADERGRVDWYVREQEDLPAYEYTEPLAIPNRSPGMKSRPLGEPTSTDEYDAHLVHPVQRTSGSLGRKRAAGQGMTSPPTVHRQRITARPLQRPHTSSRSVLNTPPLSFPTSVVEHPDPALNPAAITPRKGSLLKRALRLAPGGSSTDGSAVPSRKRTQTGPREAIRPIRALSESVRSRGGRMFDRGAGRTPAASLVPSKDTIGSPRPLSPVTQWGWAEQGVLVGVL
ncbi:unnamed protein product [Peniophora sp. CBMAI 1063]|nr:unnamed protein product [Peniophora sp. CBMAI 1063]